MSVPITPERLAASGTEDGHQMALFCHAIEAAHDDYRWLLLFAIPNGGERGEAQAARLVAAGVKRGVPDIFLPTAMGGYHGLFIELKKPKRVGKRGGMIGGGVVSDDQEKWGNVLVKEGYCLAVAWGWEQARDIIAMYLAGTIESFVDMLNRPN